MSEKKEDFELRINVSIRDTRQGGYLNIDEEVKLSKVDFFEMSAILGEFHNLVQEIKAKKGER